MVKKPPLFSLEVMIVDNQNFEYNSRISKFEEVTNNAIDHCINSLQEIPQIHVFVMDKLKWSTRPNIAAVALNESLVQTLQIKVKVSFSHVINYFSKYSFLNPNLYYIT